MSPATKSTQPTLLTRKVQLDGEPLPRLVLDEPLAAQIAPQVALAVFGRERRLETTILDRSGLANSIVVRDPDGWSELLVRYFPYPLRDEGSGWKKMITEVFEFEREHWSRWDQAIAARRSGGRLEEVAHFRPPWEADRIPCCPTLRIAGEEVPSLVRRYLPWPTVRNAMLSEERVVEMVQAFYAEVLPEVLPRSLQVPIDRALGWLRADNPRLSRDHLLTDGNLVVPTRWRSLCESERQVTLDRFQKKR